MLAQQRGHRAFTHLFIAPPAPPAKMGSSTSGHNLNAASSASYPAAAAAAPSVSSAAYALPQYQQAQQLFQRDAQTNSPEALEGVKAALASSHKADAKRKVVPCQAAGQTWEDPTLSDFPENDFRLFCGNLGNEVNNDVLSKAFSGFPSFNMAWVIRCNRTGKTKGYGFVSFSNSSDLSAALKEMDGKYVGNRPIKLKKSKSKKRTDSEASERQKITHATIRARL